MINSRLIKSNDAGGGACTNTVDLYNPFPDGGGVALYQLNGDATDVSGNYDGTATNVTYGAGQFGQAGVFNGSSSIVKNSLLGVNFRNQTVLTISAWFKTDISSGALQTICSFSNTNDASTEFSLNVRPDRPENSLGFFNRNDGSSVVVCENAGAGNVIDGQWHHVVFIADSSGTKMYFDGSELTNRIFQIGDSSTTIAMPTDLNQFAIGANTDSGGDQYFFNGSIDQVRIFNRALRPYEVEALYTEEYCTPTIVPSEHFNTVLYSGNSGTQSITSVGFAPDLTWIKERTGTDHHRLQDTVRGAGYRLYSSTTSAEGYTNDSITSFDANGFSLGSSLGVNESGQNYVAWNFKAGGAAVTNTDGTITSQVSANTEAGFSVVTFTGNGSTASVGHGLGQKPSIIFTKNRSASEGWFTQQYMYVPSGNAAYGYLNTTAAFTGFTDSLTNDTVMQQGGTNGQNYVSYCFAEVEGFSSIGSYVGTGASGNTVVTGFEPAFVMLKRTDSTGNWFILDNKRDNTNPNNLFLLANASDAEKDLQTTDSLDFVNFLENGFEILNGGSWCNANGGKYIYMAFAADPTAVEPTLEDSFNTVTYTGNATARSITGVGFQPDFVWIKNRDAVQHHNLIDSVRGNTKLLYSSLTNAEDTTTNHITSFDADGFSLGTATSANGNGNGIVAWNWKGAEIPAINSNGSIPSVVSANPAAGFSIVSYTNTTSGTADSNYTVGHGLSSAPELIITKVRNVAGYRWTTYNSFNGTGQYMALNETRASTAFSRAFPVAPTSSVFTLDEAWPHPVGGDAITYCFHSVAGFSKFGSWNNIGPVGTINMGFEPAMVIIKKVDGTDNWRMYDNKRDTSGINNNELYPNLSNAEYTLTNFATFTSTGLDFTGGNPFFQTGQFIYMAFADQF